MSKLAPRCVCCGKPAARETTMEIIRIDAGDNIREYQGNLIVSRQVVDKHANFYEPSSYWHVQRWLWDGESYRGLYSGRFCTLRCALTFANSAYEAGYRVDT